MIKRLILNFTIFFLILAIFVNYKQFQKLNFLSEEYSKEKNKLNKEFFLLKEITINLKKFRLFFEQIYLEEIKKLIKKSKILKDNTFNLLINSLVALTFPCKRKKDDLTVFSNFRELLKEKEKILKNSLDNLEIGYQSLKNERKEKLYFSNIIIGAGLIILIILVNVFLPLKRKNEKMFNNYFSLLELVKIVKEKTDKYLERITNWENKIREFKKSWEGAEFLKDFEIIDDYKKIFTYCLLNIQLGLLQKDSFLINKYFTNFQQMSEKIINLLSINGGEKLVTYFKESEEEFISFKEDLINLKKKLTKLRITRLKND